MEAARLFLPQDAVLLWACSRKDGSVIKTEAPGPYADRRVVIWQDELTASAAEIFIAPLRHAGVAVTVGRCVLWARPCRNGVLNFRTAACSS